MAVYDTNIEDCLDKVDNNKFELTRLVIEIATDFSPGAYSSYKDIPTALREIASGKISRNYISKNKLNHNNIVLKTTINQDLDTRSVYDEETASPAEEDHVIDYSGTHEMDYSETNTDDEIEEEKY